MNLRLIGSSCTGGSSGALSYLQPADLSGLILDLNPDIGVTKVGNEVTQILDQSPLHNNFVKLAGSNGPTDTASGPNEHRALVFDGAQLQFLKCDSMARGYGPTYPYTFIIVLKMNSVGIAQGGFYLSRDDYHSAVHVFGVTSNQIEVNTMINVDQPPFQRDYKIRAEFTDTSKYHIFCVKTTDNGYIHSLFEGTLCLARDKNMLAENPQTLPYASLGAKTENIYAWKDQGLYANVARVVMYNRGLSDNELSELVRTFEAEYLADGQSCSFRDPSPEFRQITTYTTSGVIDPNDTLSLLDCTSGNLAMEVLNGYWNNQKRRVQRFKRIDAANNSSCTVSDIWLSIGYKIDGANSLTLLPNESFTIISNPTDYQWYIESSHKP
jgi:hypothetical protein